MNMFHFIRIFDINSALLLISLVLGQQINDDENILNAKLVPQVSETYCSYDTDCLEENSYCKGNDAAAKRTGFCACKEDHFIQTTDKKYQCFPFVEGFGSPCIVDRQCVTALWSNSAYCDDVQGCQCDDGYHFHNNKCLKTVAIGDKCDSAYNCQINVFKQGSKVRTAFAHCVTGRCACGLNQHHMKDSNICVESVPIGSKCQSDDECNIRDEWGVCRVVCVCRVGWVVDNRGLTCLKAANGVGEPCTQLSQCTEFLGAESTCDLSTNACLCKSGAYQVGVKCYQRRYVGDYCSHRSECQIRPGDELNELQDCVEGVCQCRAGGEQRGSTCVRIGDTCCGRGQASSVHNSAVFVLPTVFLFLICV